jgi:hypothetical protein
VSNLTERLHSIGPDPWAGLMRVKQVLPAAKRTRSKKARSSN